METVLTVTNGTDSKRYRVAVRGGLRRVTGAKLKRYMASYIGPVAGTMSLRFRGVEIADGASCEDAGVRNGDSLALVPPDGRLRGLFADADPHPAPAHAGEDPHSLGSAAAAQSADVEAALLDEQRDGFEQDRARRDSDWRRTLADINSEQEQQVRDRMRLEQELRQRQEELQRLDEERERAAQERKRIEAIRQEEGRRLSERREELEERQRALEAERERQRQLEVKRVELERRQQLIEQQRLETRLERERAERERREWEERVAQQEQEVRDRETRLQMERLECERRQREVERDKALLAQQRRAAEDRFGRERELDDQRLREIRHAAGGLQRGLEGDLLQPPPPGPPASAPPSRRSSAAAHVGFDMQAERLRRAVSEAWSASPLQPAAAQSPVSPAPEPRPPLPTQWGPPQQGDCAALADACLADLASALGQPLSFDPSQTCVVEIDSKYTVLITCDRETERLYLYSSLLTNVPRDPGQRLQLYEALLEGALLGRDMAGGGVGLSVKNDFILMCTSLALRVCHPTALRHTVPVFVDALRRWRRKVRELLAGGRGSLSPVTEPDAESGRDARSVHCSPVAAAPDPPDDGVPVIGVEVTDGTGVDGAPAEGSNGVVVVRVKGAALRAGVLEGDVITAVNGIRVRTLGDFQGATRVLQPEVPAVFNIDRDGEDLALHVRPQRGQRRGSSSSAGFAPGSAPPPDGSNRNSAASTALGYAYAAR
eukprot:TRINITY_DN46777_c0_g1_i1.p1 TRINITY_DN46777_c0_g1~~TRINITY_DN46777_c0_g1_i1.p1  ORF type:complete len:744 (+),score=287.75 TRINITY_DN46777_c0_g1_i1:77-2233(+)